MARHLASLPEPPTVVFVTAHDRHAVEAFELNALDYLLKPVRAERLAAALKKASVPNREQLAKAAQGAREYISVSEPTASCWSRFARSFSCAPSRNTSPCARAAAST